MKIATWNVNSIKARLPHVVKWLERAKPDVLLLQELKCVTEAFPSEEFEDLGYNIAAYGQKTYNGVAILSKFPMDDIITQLPYEDSDQQARYIEAVICANEDVYRIASVYVPNGTEIGSERFAYKLRFFDRMREHISQLLTYEEKLIIGADYNVAPANIDVYDPVALYETLCFHPQEQRKFHALLHLGLTDAYRALYPDSQEFTWWDYRRGSFPKNHGMRIDHLLLSPQAADSLNDSQIDTEPRTWQKPSDHAPVWVDIAPTI